MSSESNVNRCGIDQQLRSALDLRENWHLTPVLSGDWKILDASHSVRLLVRTTAELTARKELIIPLEYKVLSVRACPVSCYPDCLLVEFLCLVPFSTKPAVCSLLFSPHFIKPIDFTSTFIHFELNEHGLLSINDNQQALSYLRFFCGVVTGEEGRFIIVDNDQCIEPAVFDLAGSAEYTAIKIDKEDESYKANCTILYGDSLFYAEFTITEDGVIEMVEDNPIASDLDIVQEQFQGYFRYIA